MRVSNHKQNVKKFAKLSKTVVPLQCFLADFLQLFITTLKICLVAGWLGPCHRFQAFLEFS